MKSIFNVTILLVWLVLCLPMSVMAGDWNTDKNGVVLNGYDVVAYHTENKAVKGLAKYSARYDGVLFRFENRKNRDLFIKDAASYLPLYHGYCAYAVGAKNAKVPANPKTFKIYNGKLLVFFNDVYQGQKVNTIIPWNADEKKLFAHAEKNWVKLK